MEVVAELLKLEAAVDAATKVRLTSSPITARLMLLFTIFESSTKHGCTVGLNNHSTTTVSMQPCQGFNFDQYLMAPEESAAGKSETIKKEMIKCLYVGIITPKSVT